MNSEHEQQKKEVKFLDDLPVPNDELELHKNIAKSIKRIIDLTKDKKDSNEKINKKIIGLFGSWGSGKSTVIEILKDDEFLGKDKIFIFDSWSHRGDFLKRAFLLELSQKLQVIDNEYFEKKETTEESEKPKLRIKDVLTNKIIHKDITTEPKVNLNKWGKIITFLIIFSIITFPFKDIIRWLFKFIYFHSIKWLFLLSLFILAITLILHYKKKINVFIEKFISYYLAKKIDLTESHTTKENLEFTNYDYESYLVKILEEAKNNKNNDKKIKFDLNEPFIIVFDNLDRVDDETVLNTLSLIQLTNEVIKDSKFKNIYFLIPIDKERLEKTIKTIIAWDSNNKEEKEKFAKDFLEKIFPYKVNIPNIIHSNWRKFFSKKIQEAFNLSLNEADISFIRRIFENSIKRSKEKNLTPREIKNFINSLVENYLYWENLKNKPDIKLQSIYVALNNYFFNDFKNCIKEIENTLNTNSKSEINNIINIAKEEYSEKEIKEGLLKQYYKVEEIYVLFIDSSIQAIENEKVEDLKDIVNLFEDKYKVEQLLDEIWEQKDEFRKDINSLLKLYNALKEIEFYDKYKYRIMKHLKKLIENIDTLSKLKSPRIKELQDILERNKNIKDLFIEKSVKIFTTIPEG